MWCCIEINRHTAGLLCCAPCLTLQRCSSAVRKPHDLFSFFPVIVIFSTSVNEGNTHSVPLLFGAPVALYKLLTPQHGELHIITSKHNFYRPITCAGARWACSINTNDSTITWLAAEIPIFKISCSSLHRDLLEWLQLLLVADGVIKVINYVKDRFGIFSARPYNHTTSHLLNDNKLTTVVQLLARLQHIAVGQPPLKNHYNWPFWKWESRSTVNTVLISDFFSLLLHVIPIFLWHPVDLLSERQDAKK